MMVGYRSCCMQLIQFSIKSYKYFLVTTDSTLLLTSQVFMFRNDQTSKLSVNLGCLHCKETTTTTPRAHHPLSKV
jgi:hypothetical protein